MSLGKTVFLCCCVDWSGMQSEKYKQPWIKLMLDNFIVRLLKKVSHYLTEEKNPVFQIAYVSIIVLSYFAFTVYGFPHMPNPYLSEYHK
jgi:hypothetical protein